MCGIAGYVGPPHPESHDLLRRMSAAQRHRGPDGEGFHWAPCAHGQLEVGLAHRRLAILDLAGGAQPMHSADGRVTVVFNGEIYNHAELRADLVARGRRFLTRSDTEVLLQAWLEHGEACVHRLRGMFAFAIWDGRDEVLFLARDRFGEKPLHYIEHRGALVFASEQRALVQWLGHEATLNLDVLPHYLQYRYVPGPATWVRGVRKLPPGCTLRWRAHDGFEVDRYFRPADAAPALPGTAGPSSVERLRAKLDETVRLMMDADVPYGAFLSGGLDSSTIVALMARHATAPVRTFSIGFAEAGFSELAHAAAVARAFGTAHTEITVSGSEILARLPDVAALRDAPVAEPADIPLYLLAAEASRSVRMVLTGEGSDEALGGYPKHVFERFAPAVEAVPAPLRQALLKPVARALPARARRLHIMLAALGSRGFEERMPRWFGALSPNEVDTLCGRQPTPLVNGAAYPFESDPHNSALRRILYFDQTSWLPDNLLERGDRLTMAASLEARMPFMDHELIGCAAALPDSMRVHRLQTKRALREAAAPLLPSAIVSRRKVGFAMPVHAWLRTSLRDLLEDSLLADSSLCGRLLDRPTLERIVMEHQLGRRNHDKLLWMLLNFELWARGAGLRVA
jgi:asparagine synthase (glutamine-hydrolysing)